MISIADRVTGFAKATGHLQYALEGEVKFDLNVRENKDVTLLIRIHGPALKT